MLMKLREYARHRRCHLQAVQYAVRVGRIRTDENGLIDAEIADLAWQANTREAMPACAPRVIHDAGEAAVGVTAPVPGMSFAEARRLRMIYDAQLCKLELDARAAELVSRAEVESAASRCFHLLRDACFSRLLKLAARLTVENDERTIHDLLTAEIRRVLEDFAEGRLG